MNYQHYDTLVAYLQDLIVTAPETFNYMSGYALSPAGCVDCHCRVLMGASFRGPHGAAIREFLAISTEEARALWSPVLNRITIFGRFMPMSGDEYRGEPGIREALRRLAILATRYERPAVAEPVKADPMPAALRATLDRLTRGETVAS